MIHRQGHLHDLADDNLVVANHGLFQGAGDGENGAFAGVDDGAEVLDVQHAHVRDRERAAGHFVRRQFAGARLVGELLGGGANFRHRQLAGIANHRHHQTAFDGDGEAEIHLTVPACGLAIGAAVHTGEFQQAKHDGLRDEIRDRVRRTGGFELVAIGNQVGHVHAHRAIEMRLRDDALREPLADDLAHLAHRFRLLGHGALHFGGGDAATIANGNSQHIQIFLRSQFFGRRTDAQFVVTARFQILLHIALDDAALRTGTFDGFRINHATLGQHRRPRADAKQGRSCRCRC